MSKQRQSQGARRESPEKTQNANQSKDSQDQGKHPDDNEFKEHAKQTGGEESKHGRKQKGNVDDT